MTFKIFATLLLFLATTGRAVSQDLSDWLSDLSVKHGFTIRQIQVDTFFLEKYELTFTQLLDPDDPLSGTFTQRVFLGHRGYDAPTVLITEGYTASYAGHPRYIEELSGILEANQVCVEHRYFGESVPDPLEWEYLTVEHAAADHHRIVEVLKLLYPGPWVSTGISKGGQTAMYHRCFFPEDVTATVGYVCPLNFSVEDKRVYRFLEQVSDPESRQAVIEFQQEMLRNKNLYLPEFERLAKSKDLSFGMGYEKGYELTVLEYSFAFWQWGNVPVSGIPKAGAGIEKMVSHLHRVADISWVSEEGILSNQPFFYQALAEIGFYGYDISGFSEWVSYDSNPTFEFTAPEGTLITYDPAPMRKVDQFIRHEAGNMIFIYGENDPWSATAVELTYNNNLMKVVKPGGSHMTRIRNLPEDQRRLVLETLEGWISSSK